MFCPECQVEYRKGFTRCTDCDVDLVAELPPEPQPVRNVPLAKRNGETTQDGEELRVIWEGDSESDCVDVCRELQKNEIPYRVKQTVAERHLSMRVDFKYQLAVRNADYEIARKLLGHSEENEATWTEEEVESGVAELPAQDDRTAEEVRGNWNSSDWFPEDATLEIWRGNPETSGSIVEMSLKENRINYRVEMQSEQLKIVFILPEDESRAREIVREIVEGVPPE